MNPFLNLLSFNYELPSSEFKYVILKSYEVKSLGLKRLYTFKKIYEAHRTKLPDENVTSIPVFDSQ
jgi:hypothetical protein